MYLPKREELSLRSVFALPNASRMGFADMMRDSTAEVEGATDARYWSACFVHSVLPAPDSPEMMMDWFFENAVSL